MYDRAMAVQRLLGLADDDDEDEQEETVVNNIP